MASPCCGFSLAVSGITMPLASTSSCTTGRMTMRSCSGTRVLAPLRTPLAARGAGRAAGRDAGFARFFVAAFATVRYLLCGVLNLFWPSVVALRGPY
jgi:hypothetical protein